MADQKYNAEIVRLGIEDAYVHHGTQEELWADCGFDKNAIVQNIKSMLNLCIPEKKSSKLG